MNPSMIKSVAGVAFISLALVALLVQAAPTGLDAEDDGQAVSGLSGEESAPADPEMDVEQARNGQANNDEMVDDGMSNVDTHDTQDSNIAKVQVNGGGDLAAAAGHHYSGHGHGVSGKMEMGAHTEKKGAFGWHAKFPVGGKGRR